MSTILHRRDLHVAISAEESGREFACAAADVQCEFLKGFAAAVDEWVSELSEPSPRGGFRSWPMQCRFIVDELSANERFEIAGRLETLLEHLNGPVNIVKVELKRRDG